MRHSVFGVHGEFDSLPGCTQIAVTHSVYVPPKDRGKGLGTKANAFRKAELFDCYGYDMVICTVDAANVTQRRILIKNGWTCLTSFKSRKTGHKVELWCAKNESYDGDL